MNDYIFEYLKGKYPDIKIGSLKFRFRLILKTIDKRMSTMYITRLEGLKILREMLNEEIEMEVACNMTCEYITTMKLNSKAKGE